MLFVVSGYTAFSAFVRSGVTPVPELAGLTEVEAEASLRDAGLDVRIDEGAERYDDTIEAGLVLSQSPGDGTLVKRGSTVNVVLSRGPQRVRVPDVTGQALQAAQVTLAAAGLSVGPTASVYSEGVAPGLVVDQAPPPGAEVARNDDVTLFLCREARTATFLMPDLAYREYDGVRRFFERRGFRLGSVKFEPYAGIRTGVVLRQYPLPGHPLRRRDVISLVVSGEVGA